MRRLSLGKIILRLFDPKGEKQRMEMRHARCMTQANAEDLVRTLSTNREQIAALMRQHKGKINGERR